MPDLLLELFSEEIPARMQRKAAEDLRKLVTDALVEAGLVYEGAKAFATPRRLALTVHGLPARSPDRREERKGPRVGAPEKAVEGFVKAAGLSSIAEAKVQADKKGDFYVAMVEKPGRTAEEVIAEIVPGIVRSFPWPKSMRWGEASAKPGSLAWVRPLHSILCVFGPETSDTEVVRFEVGGIASGDVTQGHRFMAPGPITVKRFDDYAPKLEKAKVVLDADRRKAIILADARDRALALGLELVEDEGLLEEVAGLVEWPVVLTGSFDAAFLAIPPEVIRATIRNNQKCFVLREAGGASPDQVGGRLFEGVGDGASFEAPLRGAPQDGEVGIGVAGADGNGANGNSPRHPEVRSRPQAGRASKDAPARPGEMPDNTLSNRFVLVANIEAPDGGAAIVAGNERVIRARLSDARHFYETDQRDLPDHDTPAMRDAAERLGLDLEKPLDQRMAKLAATNVIFHEKLGTQGERVERIARLAEEIAGVLSSRPGFFGGKVLSAGDLSREQEAFRRRVRRAAVLAKADLVTEMVGEFPELQGLMGRYYATSQGEDPSVAAAIEDHYKPVGPSDRVPTDPVAICVALADKLDLLVGFWAIDEKPTGSKDPYALRRAALGVIRVVLENGLRLPTERLLVRELQRNLTGSFSAKLDGKYRYIHTLRFHGHAVSEQVIESNSALDAASEGSMHARHRARISRDLLAFFADRLKVQLREQGARHDLVDAVFALGQSAAIDARAAPSPLVGEGGGEGDNAGLSVKTPRRSAGDPLSLSLPHKGGGDAAGAPAPTSDGRGGGQVQDDLLLIVRRVEALGRFLDTEDGRNLLAGYKRATNILREEERKSGERYDGSFDPGLFIEAEERALGAAVSGALTETKLLVVHEAFEDAMAELARLRAPVDAFFDKVRVNVDDEKVRANRLRLLNRIREATLAVADFSKIEG